MSIKIAPGLVFSIPLANEAFGFGHLIAQQWPIFYMVAYDLQSETSEIEDDMLRQAKPVLMGNFFDVLIRNGRWRRVRHFPTPVVPYPCFKVRIGNTFYIKSWDLSRQREATEIELPQLQYSTNSGPILLEHALNAYFELAPWDAAFDRLRAEAVAAVSDIWFFGPRDASNKPTENKGTDLQPIDRKQAVIIHFEHGKGDWSDFFAFEEILKEALSKTAVGDYGGNELAVDGSDGSMYIYGPDANAVFATVKPYLLGAKIMRNIVVTLQYGTADDSRVSRIKLTL